MLPPDDGLSRRMFPRQKSPKKSVAETSTVKLFVDSFGVPGSTLLNRRSISSVQVNGRYKRYFPALPEVYSQG